MKEILKVNNLIKKFPKAGGEIDDADAISVLKGINFDVEQGEYVGIMGKSGCGKTTLLKILGFMDQQTDGDVIFDGVNTNELWKEELTDIRRRKIGFVFQDFNLIHTLTVGENIMLPLTLEGIPVPEIKKRTEEIAKMLGIEQLLSKRTFEISGGQAQRTAVARAVVTNPSLLLADEPTGNLDSKATKDVMELFQMLNETQNATILMVTHDSFVASYCKRVLIIKDGQLYQELVSGGNRRAFQQEIADAMSLLGGEPRDII